MRAEKELPNLFPKATIEGKLKTPRLPEVHPILYTIYGVLHKGLGLTNTELNRSLQRYKLTQDALTLIFAKGAKSPKHKALQNQLLDYVSHVNRLSGTLESRTLQFLVNDFFHPTGTSPVELSPIPPDDAAALALQASDTPSEYLSDQDSGPVPVQLVPVLSPVLNRLFGVDQPNSKEVDDTLELVARSGLDTNSIIFMLKTTTALLQMGIAAAITEIFAGKGKINDIVNFIESTLRELSVKNHKAFVDIYSFLFRASRLPLSKNEGPRGLFPFDQYRRLESMLRGCNATDLGVYQTAYLTRMLNDQSPHVNPVTSVEIEKTELFCFFLSIISNIGCNEPKLEVWGALAERLHSLVAPQPRGPRVEEPRGEANSI